MRHPNRNSEGDALYTDAQAILDAALRGIDARGRVERALSRRAFDGSVHIVAIGKAAPSMAQGAADALAGRWTDGIVISQRRYVPACGIPAGFRFLDADHPVPGELSYAATREVMHVVDGLGAHDAVVLLLSGGGSAMFEDPLIDAQRLQSITRQLLASGASIGEINIIRKHLSAVKGGRFAERCAPARVVCLALSDVIGNAIDAIASGPACPDASTSADALSIAHRCGLDLSEREADVLRRETPKSLDNAETLIIGDASAMVQAACDEARAFGYDVVRIERPETDEARDVGERWGRRMVETARTGRKTAVIGFGEPVVRVCGDGLGGRCQELALSAAIVIAGVPGTAVLGVGSDGRDGPTDAAGGYADAGSLERMECAGFDARVALARNDSHRALSACEGLVVTGPTGANVNDLIVGLFNPEAAR